MKHGKGKVGWYVEVDKKLRDNFDKAYPAKGAKAALTRAAIKHALRVMPKDLTTLYTGVEIGRKLRNKEQGPVDETDAVAP